MKNLRSLIGAGLLLAGVGLGLSLFTGASCNGPGPAPSPTPPPTPVASCDCVVPPPDDPGWKPEVTATPFYGLAIRDAETAIGDVCGNVPETSIETLASVLITKGFCAARQNDALLVRRLGGDLTVDTGQPLFEEWHVIAYPTGCWALGMEPITSPLPYKGTYRYTGTAPTSRCK